MDSPWGVGSSSSSVHGSDFRLDLILSGAPAVKPLRNLVGFQTAISDQVAMVFGQMIPLGW